MEMQHKVKLGLLNDLHKFDDREQHRLMHFYKSKLSEVFVGSGYRGR